MIQDPGQLQDLLMNNTMTTYATEGGSGGVNDNRPTTKRSKKSVSKPNIRANSTLAAAEYFTHKGESGNTAPQQYLIQPTVPYQYPMY